VERRLGSGHCRFFEVLDLSAIRGVCHGRRLGVSRGQTHDPPLDRAATEDPMALWRTTDPKHPSLARYAEQRGASLQNRVADVITAFAGSMGFVYLHVIWFVLWLKLEPFKDVFPYGLLTMIVSLEAIFLSTFVMISQNRADVKRQVLADHQWEMIQAEERQNQQLLDLSTRLMTLTTQIHALTTEVHQLVSRPTA
jgi:uncharacterized membrane protein